VDSQDEIAREPMGSVVADPAAAAPAGEAVGRGDPEVAGAILMDGENIIAAKNRQIPFVQDGEARPVEPGDSFVCAHPEVAVPRLGDRRDRLLRQAVLGGPLIDDKLVERFGRIQGEKNRDGGPAQHGHHPASDDTRPVFGVSW